MMAEKRFWPKEADIFFTEILAHDEIRAEMIAHPECWDEGKKLADEIWNRAPERLTIQTGMELLYALALLVERVLEKNGARGIPREVTIDTLRDVNTWIENYRDYYGGLGVMATNWMQYHFTGDLFQMGRLQFRIAPAKDGEPGEYTIETHIPQGPGLTVENCYESFHRAVDFFARYFPEYDPKCIVCHSWLLCPKLSEILDQDSKIVRFMQMWIQNPWPADESNHAMKMVFGYDFTRDQLPDAPENTSLQRNLKRYLLSGGQIDKSAGYILLPLDR